MIPLYNRLRFDLSRRVHSWSIVFALCARQRQSPATTNRAWCIAYAQHHTAFQPPIQSVATSIFRLLLKSKSVFAYSPTWLEEFDVQGVRVTSRWHCRSKPASRHRRPTRLHEMPIQMLLEHRSQVGAEEIHEILLADCQLQVDHSTELRNLFQLFHLVPRM